MDFKKRASLWWKGVRKHKNKIFLAIIFLIFSSVISDIAGHYVMRVGSAASGDMILDNFGPYNLRFIFVYVWIVVLLCAVLYPLFFETDKIHEVLFNFSLLWLVRSGFIILTHLKTPPDVISVSFPWPFSSLAFENDLFFSGHTAIPLMGFFVFRNTKMKYFFLLMSLLMGFTALAMHQHYSIDVFAAFFITYGTYHLGRWITRKARELKVRYF